mgnify:CR=1 FL=1
MNVLSLFDGMSCGRIALDKANIKYDNYYHLRRKNTVMEGRFAGRTWKLAGIAKFVLQLGQQSKTREETKICSHR